MTLARESGMSDASTKEAEPSSPHDRSHASMRGNLNRWGLIKWIAGLLLLLLLNPATVRLRSLLPWTALGLAAAAFQRTPQVSFDSRSLSLLGQRVMIVSGEFHPFRLPVPALWEDVLQKMVAAGMNTVSIYTHWNLINPSPSGPNLFTGLNDLAAFLDVAQQVGIWVVVRPGPYINAETTAGGFPGWVTTIKGNLRTDASDYRQAWVPYIQSVAAIVAPYQISSGGPVILVQVENEFFAESTAPGLAAYFQDIENVLRNASIVVPLSFNDAGMYNDYASGTVAADLYGFDSYPQSFDCSNPSVWFNVLTTYQSYHAKTNPGSPLYLPEFQGGAFDPWGPNAPGYAACRTLTGADFESVFNKNLWAANAKLISIYMVYGGTNWGHLAFPGVYTSYDYGAAIAETRELTSKYTELKRQSLFLRSVRSFYATDFVSAAASGNIYKSVLKNVATGSSFTIVRQSNSSSATVTFDLTLATASHGTVTLSSTTGNAVTLHGRQSKMFSTDVVFGNSVLFYTSAEILYAGAIGGRDVLYLYGNVGDHVTLSMYAGPATTYKPFSTGPASFVQSTNSVTKGSDFAITTPTAGLSVLAITSTLVIIYADIDTAGTFWNPALLVPGATGRSNFYSFGTNDTILVGGPYLVRNATRSGSTLLLVGDLDTSVPSTNLTILADPAITSVSFNGAPVQLSSSQYNPFGLLAATLSSTAPTLTIPTLSGWQYSDSLPEIIPGFDDSKWATIQPGPLNNPFPPLYGDLWLYACEYGFCEGSVIWRGEFDGTAATGVNLSISGGEAFAATVWVNNVFLGSTFGNSSNNRNIISTTNNTFTFPPAALSSLSAVANHVVVIQDNMGQDETFFDFARSGVSGFELPKHPRGIQGYALKGVGNTGFKSWKVQGKIGGNKNFPDKVRGITNEGGLYGERLGWHLPNFPSSSWASGSPLIGNTGAGVRFYRTTFNLNFPVGYDVVMGIELGNLNFSNYGVRVELFVNGWQFGKFVSNLGPQTYFPIPEGILDYQGTNTLALSLWTLDVNGGALQKIQLVRGGVYAGGVGSIPKNNPAWTDRSTLV